MSTRYELVKHPTRERNPDQPANGFEYATEANLWAIQQNLGGDWHIQPIAGDAQPARLGGIQ